MHIILRSFYYSGNVQRAGLLRQKATHSIQVLTFYTCYNHIPHSPWQFCHICSENEAAHVWCLLHKNEFLWQNCHQGSNDIRHELVSIFLIEKPIDTSYMSVHHTWACNFYFILIKMIVLMCEKFETFQEKLLLLIHI